MAHELDMSGSQVKYGFLVDMLGDDQTNLRLFSCISLSSEARRLDYQSYFTYLIWEANNFDKFITRTSLFMLFLSYSSRKGKKRKNCAPEK